MKALIDLLYKEICLLVQQERKAETNPSFSSTSSTIFQNGYPKHTKKGKAYRRTKSSFRKAINPNVEGFVVFSFFLSYPTRMKFHKEVNK